MVVIVLLQVSVFDIQILRPDKLPFPPFLNILRETLINELFNTPTYPTGYVL